jgi:hypothetical protein
MGPHPFSAAAAKENVAPTPTKGGVNPRSALPPMIGQKPPIQTANPTKWNTYDMQQQQMQQAAARPALQALPPTGDLALPRQAPHLGRRLSN